MADYPNAAGVKVKYSQLGYHNQQARNFVDDLLADLYAAIRQRDEALKKIELRAAEVAELEAEVREGEQREALRARVEKREKCDRCKKALHGHEGSFCCGCINALEASRTLYFSQKEDLAAEKQRNTDYLCKCLEATGVDIGAGGMTLLAAIEAAIRAPKEGSGENET